MHSHLSFQVNISSPDARASPTEGHSAEHQCSSIKSLRHCCGVGVQVRPELLVVSRLHYLINVSTEYLKWCPMLQQVLENTLHPTLFVHVANDTQMMKSSDLLKWQCALWRCVNSLLLSGLTYYQMVQQPGNHFYIMSPPLWGRHIVFALSVCPSVRPSVCPSVTLRFRSITQVPFDPEPSNFIRW